MTKYPTTNIPSLNDVRELAIGDVLYERNTLLGRLTKCSVEDITPINAKASGIYIPKTATYNANAGTFVVIVNRARILYLQNDVLEQLYYKESLRLKTRNLMNELSSLELLEAHYEYLIELMEHIKADINR